MVCRPCERAERKPGRHRGHDCTGGGVTGNLGWTCDCRCQREILERILRHGGFPSLALDYGP